jgi:AraC-like DNA-binding protein
LRPISEFFPAPAQLSGCMFGGIFRDTRGTSLSDAQRYNYFPASPLLSATYLIQGDLRFVAAASDVNSARQWTPIPQFSVVPAQDRPVTSWSSGPIAVISVGFYPDAWAKLEQNEKLELVPGFLCRAFHDIKPGDDPEACWSGFCNAFAPTWQDVRATGGLADWSGSARLTDWARSVLSRTAMAGPGRSIRAFERRLKRWSRQSRQSLKFYSDFEKLHILSVNGADTELAGLASDAGYCDQSHMGRAVKRATGFSPAQLNKHIQSDEAFWCYRLLGERF